MTKKHKIDNGIIIMNRRSGTEFDPEGFYNIQIVFEGKKFTHASGGYGMTHEEVYALAKKLSLRMNLGILHDYAIGHAVGRSE